MNSMSGASPPLFHCTEKFFFSQTKSRKLLEKLNNWTISNNFFNPLSKMLDFNLHSYIWQIQYNFFLHQRINWNGTNDLKNVCKIEINKNICAAHSVEHQIAIIAQQVVCRDTATGSRSYDGSTISTFEVCLYRFIITSIAQNHAPQF